MTDERSQLSAAASWILAVSFGLAGPILAMAPLGMAPLLIGTGLLATIAELAAGHGWPRPNRSLLFGFAMLLGWSVLSLIWDIDPQLGLRKLFDLIVVTAMLLLLLDCGKRLSPQQRRLCNLWLVGGLSMGLILLVVETGFDFPLYRMVMGGSDAKLIDMVESKRSVDALPLLVWPASAALAMLGKPRFGVVLAVVFAATCTAWTASSATLGMAVSLGVLVVSWRSTKLARTALLTAIVLAFALVIPVSIAAYNHGASEAQALKRSGQHRLEIWHFTAERSLEQPLFGHGFDSSRSIPNGDAVSAFQAPGKPIIPLHPHNAVLQIWLELGFVGVAIAVPLLVSWVWAASRMAILTRPFALAGFASALVIAGLAFGIWQSWWLATLAVSALCFNAVGPETNNA